MVTSFVARQAVLTERAGVPQDANARPLLRIITFPPEFQQDSTRKKRGQTSLLHLPNERRRKRVTTLCTKGSAPLYLKGSPPFVRKGQHPLSQRVTTLCPKGSAPFVSKGHHPFVRWLVRGCSLSRGEVPLASLPTPLHTVDDDFGCDSACVVPESRYPPKVGLCLLWGNGIIPTIH